MINYSWSSPRCDPAVSEIAFCSIGTCASLRPNHRSLDCSFKIILWKHPNSHVRYLVIVINYSWSYENIHTKLWVCRLRLEITFCSIIIAVKSHLRRGGSNHWPLDCFLTACPGWQQRKHPNSPTVNVIICNNFFCFYETIRTENSVCRLRFKKLRFAALSLPWSNRSGMASSNHYKFDCSFHNLLGQITKETNSNSKSLYSWDVIILIHHFGCRGVNLPFGESRFVVSSL